MATPGAGAAAAPDWCVGSERNAADGADDGRADGAMNLVRGDEDALLSRGLQVKRAAVAEENGRF